MNNETFENAIGGDGHFVIEWTPAALEVAKRQGKRLVMSLKRHADGVGIVPKVSWIDVVVWVPDWVEQTRAQVAAGHTTAREVVAWFVCEWWNPRQEWAWEDEANGTFRVCGDLYRVRVGGIEGGWWVIEWCKVRGNHA